MKAIKITSRPQGGAPDWIRDAWIGCIIPLKPGSEELESDIPSLEVVTNRTGVMRDGYAVDVLTAISILEAANPEAVNWWRTKTSWVEEGLEFIFKSECCEVVELPDEPPKKSLPFGQWDLMDPAIKAIFPLTEGEELIDQLYVRSDECMYVLTSKGNIYSRYRHGDVNTVDVPWKVLSQRAYRDEIGETEGPTVTDDHLCKLFNVLLNFDQRITVEAIHAAWGNRSAEAIIQHFSDMSDDGLRAAWNQWSELEI